MQSSRDVTPETQIVIPESDPDVVVNSTPKTAGNSKSPRFKKPPSRAYETFTDEEPAMIEYSPALLKVSESENIYQIRGDRAFSIDRDMSSEEANLRSNEQPIKKPEKQDMDTEVTKRAKEPRISSVKLDKQLTSVPESGKAGRTKPEANEESSERFQEHDHIEVNEVEDEMPKDEADKKMKPHKAKYDDLNKNTKTKGKKPEEKSGAPRSQRRMPKSKQSQEMKEPEADKVIDLTEADKLEGKELGCKSKAIKQTEDQNDDVERQKELKEGMIEQKDQIERRRRRQKDQNNDVEPQNEDMLRQNDQNDDVRSQNDQNECIRRQKDQNATVQKDKDQNEDVQKERTKRGTSSKEIEDLVKDTEKNETSNYQASHMSDDATIPNSEEQNTERKEEKTDIQKNKKIRGKDKAKQKSKVQRSRKQDLDEREDIVPSYVVPPKDSTGM